MKKKAKPGHVPSAVYASGVGRSKRTGTVRSADPKTTGQPARKVTVKRGTPKQR